MVGLALKDQGIDVVAVGNGEAAVRKIADLKPDLVLADVFMPVRNGYEVCEFVKTDSKLAHIPVILLVGAFDPLDEQEAQRVGADGVLKKPFVPPDPLISMVRSALARAGVATIPEPSAAPPPPAAGVAEPWSVPNLGTIPHSGGAAESQPEPVAKFPVPVSIPPGEQPLAFGNLLGASSAQPGRVDEPVDDADLIVARHPEFENDRAWNAPHVEDESEEEVQEEAAEPSWRRDAGDEAFGGTESHAEEKKDWRATVIASIMEKKRELAAMVGYPETAPAEKASALVAEKEPESAPPATGNWSSALSEALRVTTPVKESVAVAVETRPAPVSEPEPAAPARIVKDAPATPWYTNQASPWDAEAQKATEMASTWDAPAAASASQASSSKPVSSLAEAPAESASTIPPSAPKSMEAAPDAATPDSNMDAMVAKVMAKLSPDMLQNMTKELLKPVVEAIVRGEMESKK